VIADDAALQLAGSALPSYPRAMPRLLLLRHADAERTPTGGTDHDRALTKRGRKESAAAGETIAEYGPVDLVLCSDAVRARETWERAAPALGAEPKARLLSAIYEANDYVPILRAEGGDAGTILLVGHNPAMHETALSLNSRFESAEARILSVRFPKGALAVLEFEGSWAELEPGAAVLKAFVLPAHT
jgi:phosphohistidine phosphatase